MSRELTIRQTHAAITEAALEILANKGLLRRAQKDLERGDEIIFHLAAAGLTATVSGQQVTLNEAGPAKATCTCPSPGVCQHILIACLKLMTEPAGTPTGSAHDDWLAFSDDELVVAFGLPTLREAHAWSMQHPAEIERTSVLNVRFPTLNAAVVGVPGAGIGGIIANGLNEKKHAQLAACALLVVRRAAGCNWEPPVIHSERSGPAHRDSVLASVSALLEEAVACGLARLSPALVERFDALAISAKTAELYRLGLTMQRIAAQADDFLRRRPHADLGQIFNEMAAAYALAHAAPHLAGTGRENYIEVGTLDLVGVAAWPWRTTSGYEGLTLLMWDSASADWNTWTDARPQAFRGGFSAVARYNQSGPWDGAESPARLARTRFRVLNGKRNRWGRLSASSQSTVLITEAADLGGLPMCDDWTALDFAPAVGLTERDPRRAYQILNPTRWERCAFDAITQRLAWLLYDRHGNAMEMSLAYDEFAKLAIEHLEALTDADLENGRLLGRCVLIEGCPQIQPLALIRDGRVISIFFGEAKIPPATTPVIPPQADDEEIETVEIEPAINVHGAVPQFVLAAISTVEWLAESGVRSQNAGPPARLGELRKQAIALGLTKLGKLLSPQTGAEILRLRWILAVMQRTS